MTWADRPRATRILVALAENGEPMTTMELMGAVDGELLARTRQSALTRCGGVLRYHAAAGRVTRAGRTRSERYHRTPCDLWQITEAGRAWLDRHAWWWRHGETGSGQDADNEPDVPPVSEHPLIRGLIAELPPEGGRFTPEQRRRWLDLCRSALELIYDI